MEKKLLLLSGKNLNYGFPNHPMFSGRLLKAFEEIEKRGIVKRKGVIVMETRLLEPEILHIFHEKEHVNFVKEMAEKGEGYLDYGDTPAYKNVFEDALAVVSASVIAVEKVFKSEVNFAFNIAGGLHHAFPDRSAGFCVFNDVGVAISYLLRELKARVVLYVDMDAHHGDGVFYSFYSNPRVWIADVHQTNLFPGTGLEFERGEGEAFGTKLNIPLEPGAGDEELLKGIKKIVDFGMQANPEIILLQAGADGIKGDPLTRLNFSVKGHFKAFKEIYNLAEKVCEGKLVVFGGGGYNIENVKKAWFNIADFLSR